MHTILFLHDEWKSGTINGLKANTTVVDPYSDRAFGSGSKMQLTYYIYFSFDTFDPSRNISNSYTFSNMSRHKSSRDENLEL